MSANSGPRSSGESLGWNATNVTVFGQVEFKLLGTYYIEVLVDDVMTTGSTAHEAALKIRELSSLVVEAYSPADLMHGPIAAIGRGWPVVAIAPAGPAQESVTSVLAALEERGARVLMISDSESALARADTPLPLVSGVPEWLSPLTAVIPAQVTAMRFAALRGLDVDNPAGLRKITLTR